MATTFHTAIFTREGTLGLTIAECESSSAAVVASVKPMCARCPGGAYGLSKARAEAIKSFVAKCGVDVDRVYAVGFAGTRRLSDDITEEKGAVNRRVEVHMMPYAPPGRL